MITIRLFFFAALLRLGALPLSIEPAVHALALIGGQGPGGVNRFSDGKMDEVRVYSRASTQSEIQADISTSVGSPPNQPATVNAGPDHTITLPATLTLGGPAWRDGVSGGRPL